MTLNCFEYTIFLHCYEVSTSCFFNDFFTYSTASYYISYIFIYCYDFIHSYSSEVSTVITVFTS